MNHRHGKAGAFMRMALFSALVSLVAPSLAFAQGADFGFGGETAGGTGVVLGGEARIDAFTLIDDLENPDGIDLGDLASVSLSVTASGDRADAVVRLSLSRDAFAASPEKALDEAFVRVTPGILSLEAGLMKVTWGKADSNGPLDVVNPVDFSDLTVTDSLEWKIARPMLRPALTLGPMTRIEGVFVPSFVGNAYAANGPFKPAAIAALDGTLAAMTGGKLSFAALDLPRSELNDFQSGIRFTTTTGAIDWGAQYYYGLMRAPTVLFGPPASFSVTHDRFHQAGADMAAVLFGLNVRAEAAATVTEDREGDDPDVRNPELEFSLGCDKEILGGLAVNAQYGGRFLVGYGEISSPRDVQATADEFASKVTVKLSRIFFKDALKLDATAIWNVQSEDYLILPGVEWKVGDATMEFAAGLFGGDADGELGQFKDASYVRTGIRYAF